MTKNINNSERIARITAGAIIASLAFWGPQNYWFLLGMIPVLTGFFGICPLYSALGISTCSNSKRLT